MPADYDRAIARLPRWIIVLGLAGTGLAGRLGGARDAAAFLAGSVAAYVNFRLIERTVNRLGRLAMAGTAKLPRAGGVQVFMQFALLVLGAFVILRYSGFNFVVALYGFLVCPAAVIVEILYELLTYDHA